MPSPFKLMTMRRRARRAKRARKLIFAFIPPTAMANGYITFVVSIAFIGACTAIIGDVAGHLGCFIYLKDGVNAIAFVALGTSVPDTFASKTAAIEDETAD